MNMPSSCGEGYRSDKGFHSYIMPTWQQLLPPPHSAVVPHSHVFDLVMTQAQERRDCIHVIPHNARSSYLLDFPTDHRTRECLPMPEQSWSDPGLLSWWLLTAIREARRQNRNRTVARLQQYSSRGRWRDRGWLVVMRARYLRMLSAARRNGWAARLTGRSRRSPEVTLFNKATRRKAAGRPTTSDIDVEAGSGKREFVWAVVTVVEMEEEGLFRHVLSYL